MTDQRCNLSPQEASGNPFKTTDLIEMRWRHRRRVRCVPDHIVKQVYSITVPVLKDADKRQLVEDQVRRRADLEASPILDDYLAGCERTLRTQGFVDVLRDLSFDHPFGRLAEEIDKEARDGRIEHPTREIGPALSAFVFLNFVADDLADDGYRDPRRDPLPVQDTYVPARIR